MADAGFWIVGTPDDCVEGIKRLDERSGGYGGLLVQTIDWAPRDKCCTATNCWRAMSCPSSKAQYSAPRPPTAGPLSVARAWWRGAPVPLIRRARITPHAYDRRGPTAQQVVQP